MTARKPRKAGPEFRPGQLLDWTDSSHTNHTGLRPCRYCGVDTGLLDSGRHSAHKVCAEQALAQQVAEAAEAYGRQTL